MPKYVVSEAAGSDVRGIIRYTTNKWNAEQAVRYAAGLQDCFQLLARHPDITAKPELVWAVGI